MSDIPDPESAQGDDVDVIDDDAGEARDDAYNPTHVQVTRGREQGLGMGARDLQLQDDPRGGDDETETERLMRATAPKSGLTGLPDTEAQKASTAEPGYPVQDGDDLADDGDDSRPDSNRRA
jgi:hypothetical protein